jgi:phage-related protein
MSNLVDIRNRLNKAFSDTESGKLPWDNESMQRAYAMLKDVNDRIEKVKANLKDPNKLEIDVDPTGELESLYARLREIQQLISDMRNNKINFSTEDMRSALSEMEQVQKRINELEGRGSNKEDRGSLQWMAEIIAIQHELEKASAIFDKFSERAKNTFLKALTPLKLFKHEFEEIKTLVERIGSGFAMVSKPISKIFDNFRKHAEAAFAKISKAWHKVLRTFTFMLIRKSITAILSNINEAVKSLAAFSKSIGTDFNGTMSLLSADFRYIGASLVAAFEPILNYITPSLDRLVDSIVAVINKVNMFLAVLTGAKSYTIAKKKIMDYTDSVKDANKAVKQLTLGIDELNILNEDTSSINSKEKEDPFDWVELPTPHIDLPDWMKLIKELMDAFMNALKDAWERVREYLKAALKRLGEAIKNLVKAIIEDLIKLFNTEKFRNFLELVLLIVGKIANFIAIILEKITEAWKYNELGYKILEHILDILTVIAQHINNILDMMIEWAESLTFIPLFEAIEKALGQVAYAVDKVGYVVEDVAKLFLNLAKYLIEDWAPRLIKVFGNVAEGVGNIFDRLHAAWTELDFSNNVAEAFNGLVQAILPHIEMIGEYFKEWGKNLDFKPILKAFEDLLVSLKPVADFIGGVFEDIVTKYILPMVKHIVEKVIPGITKAISNFADAVDWEKLRKNIGKVIEAFEHVQDAIGEGVADAIDRIGQAVAKFVNSEQFQKFLDNLASFMNRVTPEMISNILTGIGLAILRIAEAVVRFVNSDTFQHFLNALLNFLENADANKIADILLNIAKSIIFFKFASFVGKGFANFLTFVSIIGKGIQGFKAIGEFLAAAGEGIGAVMSTIGGIAAVIGGAILAIKEFIDMWVGGWDVIKTILEAIGIALAAVGAVVLGAPALVAAVVAGIVFAVSQLAILLHEHWDAISEWFSETWGAFKDWCSGVWEGIVQGIADIWSSIKEKFASAWEGIQEFFGGLWETFKEWCAEVWNGIVDTVVGVWSGFTEKIGEAWSAVSQWFSETWETFKEWAGSVWGTIVDAVVGAWNGFIEKISAVWETVKAWFSETWEAFKEWVGSTWDGIVQRIVDAWNFLKEKIQGIWQSVHDWIVEKWDWLKEHAQEVFNFIHDHVVEAWEKIKAKTIEIWEKVWNKIKEVWNWLKDNVGGFFGKIRDTIIDVWNKIHSKTSEKWTAIHGFLGSTWESIKGYAEDKFTTIRDFLHDVWDKVESKWQTVWSGIKETTRDLWDKIKTNAHTIFGTAKSYLETVWDNLKGKWQTTWGSIKETVVAKWDEFKSSAKTKFREVRDTISQKWDEIKSDVEPKWNGIKTTLQNKWTALKGNAGTIFGQLADTVGGAWKSVKNAVKDTWDNIGGFLDTLVKKIKDFISNILEAIGLLDKLQGKEQSSTVGAYAEGGFPSQGSVFVAGEKGAELVGTINNKTAVANADQISSAIEDAVSSAMEKIVRQMENALDRTSDVIAETMEKFTSQQNQVIVELRTISANIQTLNNDLMDVIHNAVSHLEGMFTSVAQSITSSNKELHDSYTNDSSAVDSAFTRMSSSYEFSNLGTQQGIEKLADVFQSSVNKINDNVKSCTSSLIGSQKEIVSVAHDMKSSISSMSMANTGTDTSGIIDELRGIAERIEKQISITTTIGNIVGVIAKQGMGINPPAYASGGFPEDGWFRASHGEMLGRFDNGQSVVANNEQITDGIAQAVSSALVPILQDIAESSRETANKDLSLSVDSREIAKATNNGQNKLGRNLISFV